MTWIPDRIILSALLFCLLWVLPLPTHAQQQTTPLPPFPDQAEAWLLTYGPGELYWESFGHNAIWIRDPARGLDHAFNFGFFDFAQEDFFLRFLQGRMLYFSAARPTLEEIEGYILTNRSVRAQKLNLDPQAVLELTRFLVNEVQPENRDYLYDYYSNNCSTRLRDAIDEAVGGQLRAATEHTASGTSWRDHTRSLTKNQFWLYLGLQVVLGAPVDREISLWEEMFIPDILAREVEPLVVEDTVLHAVAGQANDTEAVWGRYLLFSLSLLLVLWLAARFVPWVSGEFLVTAWLLSAGVMGAAMCFFWFGTDHSVARLNLNLLVFSPLWLLAVFCQNCRRPVALLILLAALTALLMPFLPPGQYTWDVLAAFLPINLACALILWRQASNST